jgi:uncharacterized membrane protein YccF (DUF307 family)
MKLLGNILWLIFGGLLSGLSWILSGVLWCITTIRCDQDDNTIVLFGIEKRTAEREEMACCG